MTQGKLEITIVSLRALHEGECVSLRVLHFEAKAQREMLVDICGKCLLRSTYAGILYTTTRMIYVTCTNRRAYLAVFKITMLKEICAHFELQFKSKDKKQTLIDKISSMIGHCTCFQINN